MQMLNVKQLLSDSPGSPHVRGQVVFHAVVSAQRKYSECTFIVLLYYIMSVVMCSIIRVKEPKCVGEKGRENVLETMNYSQTSLHTTTPMKHHKLMMSNSIRTLKGLCNYLQLFWLN